jgi:cystathionine beta-lyase
MAGVHLALTTLCEDAPVVVPTPAYPPFLDVVPLAGREIVTLPLDPDAEVAALDLDRVDAALAAGARTVLLCNPSNPWGRAFSVAELEGLRDVVTRHGARVVADDIHAPLVLPGATHVPYASLPGAAEHTTTVLSASKAFNVPGLKCAQVVAGSVADLRALRSVPLVANHGTSPLGIAANLAAYTGGRPWLDALVERLAANRDSLEKLVAEELPGVRMRRLEATYLAWLDVRALGLDDPAEVARSRGRCIVNDGRTFGPGGDGHVRLNIATSPERLADAVRRLATAWY